MKYVVNLISLMFVLACGQVGPQGPTGPQGPAGAQGQAGQDGAQGPAGADGTIITVVQLCPGTSNYGTFIEVAECINGKLYGVYSANGGFLTYLANGAWSSNAVGSACNFVVSGCTVTPQ